MSRDPAISVQNVSKTFSLGLSGRTDSIVSIVKAQLRHPFRLPGSRREQFRALTDVTFEVQAGEVVGVIGKNGAGKSTLLKILSRITPPSSGHIDIVGHVGSLLEVGTGFHPELTGLENVYLNGTILGMSKDQIRERLDAIVDFADVHKFLDTPVKRYSSGMRVRLAFSVAAHLDAEILIVDEVLSVGDFSFQAKCLEKMRSITTDEGRTVLYVSHNLVTVENLCSRTLLLDAGRLLFDGSTDEAISQYLHLFPRGEREVTPGVFDLLSADRSGVDNTSVLFRSLRLRPGGERSSDAVRMGDHLRIEIDVEGLDVEPDAMVHAIVSTNNQMLFRMNGRMMPLVPTRNRCPRETIVIDIPSLTLTPGECHIDLYAYDKAGRLMDQIVRAA